ncbi:MAG: EF-hand domain-containing protein, partial [Candidatus Gastranaerophilales bacterium]|nr:EF-hand domain-containing protein [Candidatus Gastranaerophilales bacterium]
TSTYSALLSSSSSGKGISLDDLSNLSSTTLLSLGSNYSFVQYLTNNFSSIDQDGDGEITSNDLSNVMSTMQSQGLTYSEIQSLCASGSGDTTLYSTVLQYFNKIDANGDGRVTSDEITKFSYDCQEYEMEKKYNSFKATSTSLYYSDGVEDDTSSVLDALQPTIDS